MNIVVPPSGILNATTIRQAVGFSSKNQCIVDLRRATFIEPAGLVAVAATVERAVREGGEVRVRAPDDGGCRNYLARMQVGSQLSTLGVHHNLGTVRSHDVGDQLQELRRFDSEHDLEEVARTIISLYGQAGIQVVQPLYQALFELGVNAVQHSGQGGGYVALQAFPRANDVAFAIGDSGRGLRASLAMSMSVPSDEAALALAAQKHVTNEGVAGRGRGITGVIELTGQHSGTVTMASGTAHGIFARGHWDPRVSAMTAPFLGTLAQARLAREGRPSL